MNKTKFADFRKTIFEGLYERAFKEIQENTEEYLDLDEAIKRKMIVRGQKKKIVKRTDKEGYKTVGGKEIRMTAKEKRKRAIAGKKNARKNRGKQDRMAKKRARSMKRR